LSADTLRKRIKREAEKAKKEAKNSSRLVADHEAKEAKALVAQVRLDFIFFRSNILQKYALFYLTYICPKTT
jgi:hypothetical protein